MAQQNRYPEAVVPAGGAAANIVKATTYPQAKGELAYSSDTKQLFIGDDPETGGSFFAPLSKGSAALTAGTTTTVTDANAKTTSVIIIQPRSAAILALAVYVSAKNNGDFVLTHTIAAGTETFDYAIIN